MEQAAQGSALLGVGIRLPTGLGQMALDMRCGWTWSQKPTDFDTNTTWTSTALQKVSSKRHADILQTKAHAIPMQAGIFLNKGSPSDWWERKLDPGCVRTACFKRDPSTHAPCSSRETVHLCPQATNATSSHLVPLKMFTIFSPNQCRKHKKITKYTIIINS